MSLTTTAPGREVRPPGTLRGDGLPFALSAAFKRERGISPREYRTGAPTPDLTPSGRRPGVVTEP
jgi:hypothetical protein